MINDQIYLGYDDVFIIPQYSEITSRQEVSTESTLFSSNSDLVVELSVPVISANMDTVTESAMAIACRKEKAIGALHRFMTVEENLEQYKTVSKAGYECFVSIGINSQDQKRTEELYEIGARRFIIDIAHGHSKAMRETIRDLRLRYGKKIFIVAGNVATAEGCYDLGSWGADVAKVGIGPGFVCTTKDVTGVTVPIFTCVKNCCELQTKVQVIADGGLRSYGDVAKAIGAGAKAVMSGYFFAGCDEVPDRAKVFDPVSENQSFIYRGMASSEAMKVLKKDKLPTPEGKAIEVHGKGSAERVLKELAGGLRSAYSYVDAQTTEEFQSQVTFGRKR